MDMVTASDLVRHFGTWRDRALARPVYIRHHGRAKLVLASVDFMDHLVSRRGGADDDAMTSTLVGAIDAVVLLVDDGLRITAASPLARRHLLRGDTDGDRLEGALAAPLSGVVLRALRLSLETRVRETLQLRTGTRGDRRIDIVIHPVDGGAVVVGHDRTAADAAALATARAAAIEQALAQLGRIASLRINLRGYIVDASPAFEDMTGLPAGGYRSVRLPTLFDLPTRVAVGDALERTIETLNPCAAKARLVSNAGDPIPVCIAFSAETLRAGDADVVAIVAVQ